MKVAKDSCNDTCPPSLVRCDFMTDGKFSKWLLQRVHV